MRSLPSVTDTRALVGASTADDAAVYRLSDDVAVVVTVDFITPVVNDPYTWGSIAAANALSDVYAMGAQPLFALNTVNFPRDSLPLEVLERVLQGGAAKATEAGIPILGGHSVDDPEPKYGMVAVGMVDPKRILRNFGARPGDALVLTKPLGVGIITTAIKRGMTSPEEEAAAVEVMATLNREAAEAAVSLGDGIHALTDVTGFGLLGHLAEMVRGSEVRVHVDVAAVPVLEAARAYVEADVVPGGTRRNLTSIEDVARFGEGVGMADRLMLADAQTSGGLLIAVAAEAADELVNRIRAGGPAWATRIGTFGEGPVGIDVT